MKLIATIREHDVFPDRAPVADELYTHYVRRAVRMVLQDADGLIAAIFYPAMTHIIDGVPHEARAGYMLPGGGVDEGEEIHDALVREAKEETGCDITDVRELGYIMEYGVGRTHKHAQEEYFFWARVAGEKGVPMPTEQEIEWKAEIRWLSITELVSHFESDPTSPYMAHVALLGLREAEKK